MMELLIDKNASLFKKNARKETAFSSSEICDALLMGAFQLGNAKTPRDGAFLSGNSYVRAKWGHTINISQGCYMPFVIAAFRGLAKTRGGQKGI
jgi:hypothetical protein